MTVSRCGTIAGYRQHSRAGTPTCRACKDAQAAWQRAYEVRRYVNRGPLLVCAVGTGRRIRALGAIGWSFVEIGRRLEISAENMHRLPKQKLVHRETAEKVRALYDELSMLPGPSLRAQQMAKAKGWPPPLAWDDEAIDDPAARPVVALPPVRRAVDRAAVERRCRGDRKVTLNRAEMHASFEYLNALGYSSAAIAERLGVTRRSVERWRSKLPHPRLGKVA